MAIGRTLVVAASLAALAVLGAAGCVDRRFVVESNVPNAQVFIDNQPIGAAPAYAPFEYYGYYTVTLVHPGFVTETQRIHVTAPWYAYPPFDFLAEVLWPFHIRDTRRYRIDLHESTQTRVEDLINNAEALRQRGWSLPQPEHPAAPKPPRQSEPAPPAVPGRGGPIVPPTLPPPTPVPTPELVPSVRP